MPAGTEAEARRFYGDILGMQEIPKPEPLQASGGCWFVGGDAHLHLGVQEPFVPARKAHPALLVSDLEQMRARLLAHDVAIHTDPRLPDFPRFYVNDPFGNRLELMQAGSGFSEGA